MPADTLGGIAELLEGEADFSEQHGFTTSERRFRAAASSLRSLDEALRDVAILLRQFEQHSDPRFKQLSARLRPLLSGEPATERRET